MFVIAAMSQNITVGFYAGHNYMSTNCPLPDKLTAFNVSDQEWTNSDRGYGAVDIMLSPDQRQLWVICAKTDYYCDSDFSSGRKVQLVSNISLPLINAVAVYTEFFDSSPGPMGSCAHIEYIGPNPDE